MNCKPPCIAYIAKADLPDLVGLVVEGISEFRIDPKYGHCWHVRSASPVAAWDVKKKTIAMVTDFMTPDDYLRPISGLPINVELKDEVTA